MGDRKNQDKSILRILAMPGCKEIIMELNSKGTLNFGKLANIMDYRAKATRILKELKNKGIVERRILDDGLRTTQYTLTEKGKAIAEVLIRLDGLEK
jgi:DNA-binding HxlR family transcriptional regulator